MNALTDPRTPGEPSAWVRTADGAQLSLKTLEPEGAANGIAVLCLHGIFSDGRFFHNAGKRGPASYFLERGYRVFVGELRGHGQSRKTVRRLPRDWSFDHYVEHDVPRLIEQVRALHDGPIYVVAHSFGGYTLLASLGVKPELQKHLRGVCLFSSAVNDYTESALGKRVFFNLAVLISGVLGYLPARRMKLGVSDAPHALMKQFRQWAGRGTFTHRHGTVDYWKALGAVKTPVWAAVGSADKFHASVARGKKLLSRVGSADKTFVEPGRAHGFSRDFGHTDVIRGEAAAKETLPLVDAWILAHEASHRAGESPAHALSTDAR